MIMNGIVRLLLADRSPINSSHDPSKGFTYAQAGVSIEAGDELGAAHRPDCQRTQVPGVLAGVGGFSALFDLKSAAIATPFWFRPPTASAPS